MYKNEFEKIDTKEKAYVLGLLASDGCIYYTGRGGSCGIKLKLQEKDKDLLDKISDLFPFFCKPKLEINRSSIGGNSYYIYCYSKKFFNDLKLLGIYERKSYENRNLCFLPELEKDLFFSYLLGYFDGDGTISQDSLGRIRIDLNGVNENLYKEISEKLKFYEIDNKLYIRKDKGVPILRISNKKNVKKLIQNFENNELCLERKFKPYFKIDWNRIPGFDVRYKNFEILFVTRNN